MRPQLVIITGFGSPTFHFIAGITGFGDLIYVQKKEHISLEYLRTLVRLKPSITFPVEITVDVGVHSFIVKLEDDGAHVLRSKVMQGPVPAPAPASHNLVYVPKQPKDKEPFNSLVVSYSGETVEHSSVLGQLTRSIASGSQGAALPSPADRKFAGKPRIPAMSREFSEKGDTLLPCSGNVTDGCSTAIDLPRDENSPIIFGSMHPSLVPRDCLSLDSRTFPVSQSMSRDEDSHRCSSHRGQDIDSIVSFHDLVPLDKYSHTPPSIKADLPRDTHTPDPPSDVDLTPQDHQHPDTIIPPNPKDASPRDDNFVASKLVPIIPTQDLLSSHDDLTQKPTDHGNLPTHLKPLPSSITIPDGYKWILFMETGPLSRALILINFMLLTLLHRTLH